MKYVLDANVGLRWLLPEADSDKALRIRDDHLRQVHDLIAPDVFAVEVAHSLTRAERQGRITPAEGRAHFGDMIATLPLLQPYLPLLRRAYELSSQARIGLYDCIYVALTEREGCELLTADDRLKRSLPSHRIVLLSSMPRSCPKEGSQSKSESMVSGNRRAMVRSRLPTAGKREPHQLAEPPAGRCIHNEE